MPKCTLAWFKDGNQLNASKKVILGKPVLDQNSGSYLYTLSIPDSQPIDSGVYTVKASNKVATVESKCSVNVLSSPRIVKDLKPSVEVTENDTVHLEVNAVGKPQPQFKWFFFNTETNSEQEIVSTENVYIVQCIGESVYSIDFVNIKKEMQGKYTLKLSNNAGSVETSCNIVVNGKLFI